MKKLFIKYDEIHRLTHKIAMDIQKDWQPDVIVAIASGGFIPARILKTYLKKDIYVVGLKRYSDTEEAIHHQPIKIQWIDEVEKKIKDKKILLVDEVDDTRLTLSYCLKELLKHDPKEIRVAILHQKLKPKEAEFPPEIKTIYQGEQIDDVWIKYPWEAVDIDKHNNNLE
ncbi:MAG: phosphoribosyltransferase [Spirochaetes bacterium GWD1_27_9]|nr:MAG: phosphoribosyltransferase [Spirochaetes bacterium GWB1_27_13]OHD24571.1 MAG: phosphoribosyltransferase [Spirochaetes bacterium GWC1_27_15]OHD40539.1 MAG: phosphoribosyltransferase [Spirochaetes bacterium GWD1_27_9]